MSKEPELRVDQLRAIVAVAREGGFSRAARALGRSQSSISQAVAALEEDVRELLVVRDGRQIHMTEAGRLVVEQGARVLAALHDARDALGSLAALTSGTLSLGTSDTFAIHLLTPVLARFRANHPQVELRLDNRPSPVVAARVADRALDLGIVSLPLPPDLRSDGRLISERIRITAVAPLRDVAIVPPGHPLARRRRMNLEQLAEHPLVLLDRSTSSRSFLDAAMAARRVPVRVAMEMNSVEVIKRLVALGFGISVVPELAVRDEVVAGTLAAIPIAGFGRGRSIGTVVPAFSTPSRAARAFIDLLGEVVRAP